MATNLCIDRQSASWGGVSPQPADAIVYLCDVFQCRLQEESTSECAVQVWVWVCVVCCEVVVGDGKHYIARLR